MTRRLRIAGTAFGAMLLPACTGFQPDPMGYPAGFRPLPGVVAPPVAAKAAPADQFAEARGELPALPPLPSLSATPPPQIVAIEHRTIDPPTVSVDAPRLILPRPADAQPTELAPDADGVTRPPYPIIKGILPVEDPPAISAGKFDALPPPVTPKAAPPAPMDPPPTIVVPPTPKPARLLPGEIGSSVHEVHSVPVAGIADVTPKAAPATDPPFLRAVRASLANKPDEAVDHLRSFDPATQQIFLSLLPALVQLSEGRLQQMKPEEMDVVLDAMNRVPAMLRPRASLRAHNVCLCRDVQTFAHVTPFPPRHEFRAGDVIYPYVELANFSCMPDSAGGFAVALAWSLEVRNAAGSPVWGSDLKQDVNRFSSAPQDFYCCYRFCVPDSLAPGQYSLIVRIIDKPTGRDVRQALEFRVGAR